jgi:ABC-type dipeptide/oligopeptide/nickel transport system ATPase component
MSQIQQMMKPKLQIYNFNGWETLVSRSLGIRPFFSQMIRNRVYNKLCTNIAVTGEPGIGKSYMAIDIARTIEGLMPDGRDRFDVKQIVFRHSQYMEIIVKLKMGKVVVFDEPSYSMGKRDWFNEVQKVLVHTLESQRFLVHPLLLPIINMALLDKTIRQYLIQFQIHVIGRGHGMVYRIKPSQISEKVYRYQMGHLYFRLFDNNRCPKDTCLGCKSMDSCPLFRAQYERKKKDIQLERYDQAKEQASQKESQDLTDQQIETIILEAMKAPKRVMEFKTEKGLLDVAAMRLYLRDQGMSISSWKAYNIKRNLEKRFPELFGE